MAWEWMLGLHDIKGTPGKALSKLSIVLRKVGHCHAALPVEGLHVVQQEKRAHACRMPCNPQAPASHSGLDTQLLKCRPLA